MSSTDFTPDVLENLSSSYDGVMALYRMMQNEEPKMSVRDAGNNGKAEGLDELNSMMRDPRYWREKDPSFVAQVTDGFRKIYGQSKS